MTANEDHTAPSFDNVPSEGLDSVKVGQSVRANRVVEEIEIAKLKDFMLLEGGPMLKCRNRVHIKVKEIHEFQSRLLIDAT